MTVDRSIRMTEEHGRDLVRLEYICHIEKRLTNSHVHCAKSSVERTASRHLLSRLHHPGAFIISSQTDDEQVCDLSISETQDGRPRRCGVGYVFPQEPRTGGSVDVRSCQRCVSKVIVEQRWREYSQGCNTYAPRRDGYAGDESIRPTSSD